MINSFLKYLRCELNYSDHTVLSYSTDINQFAEYVCGGAPIESFDPCSVTVNDIRAWITQMAEQRISHRSIRRKVSALSALFRYLMHMGLMKENPAKDTPVAKVSIPLPTYVRPAEIAEVLDSDVVQLSAPASADEFIILRNHLILLMLYSTGMRLSELIGLTDHDINLSQGELKVLGKRNKERIIPFGDELAGEIANYISVRNHKMGLGPHCRFFILPNGKPLYPMLVQRITKNAFSGHTHATRESPHTLRHSFASDMLNNGADLSSVRELLGHKSLATTQVYTHITYSELRRDYMGAHPRAREQK